MVAEHVYPNTNRVLIITVHIMQQCTVSSQVASINNLSYNQRI